MSEYATQICKTFIAEMYRLLAPGGVFMVVSLNHHTSQDIFTFYERDSFKWTVAYGQLRNPNFIQGKRATEFYTIIVCRKTALDSALQPTLDRLCQENMNRYEIVEGHKLRLKSGAPIYS